MDERNLEAVFGEFLPDDKEMERQIVAEWDRMYEQGEVIRAGDASSALFARWKREWGEVFFAILHRMGFVDDSEAAEE